MEKVDAGVASRGVEEVVNADLLPPLCCLLLLLLGAAWGLVAIGGGRRGVAGTVVSCLFVVGRTAPPPGWSVHTNGSTGAHKGGVVRNTDGRTGALTKGIVDPGMGLVLGGQHLLVVQAGEVAVRLLHLVPRRHLDLTCECGVWV